MHGLVIKNTGSWYTIQADNGTVVEAKVKGNFRIKGIRSTNPVAIGDKVEFDLLPDNVALITSIDERINYIVRKATNLSKQSHIIAANLDQCFLIVTVAYPETSTTFIDRFLASAEAYRIPVTIVFNKIDLLKNAPDTQEPDNGNALGMEYLEGLVALYEHIGYKCCCVSAATGEGMDALAEELKGKVTLLSGNSGVGKSTMLNALFPELHLKTGEISDAYNTGKHTTTFSAMYPIGDDGYIIDTPGIKGFGTFDMERTEVGHYFKDIFQFAADCRFSNCTHTHEPGCAVREAVERHDISESRYNSYISMLGDKEEDRYRQGY
ncbi:MAG: ribosome small subunit-dependent GTPase A [Bacteroides sp.]|nr:ribosome small subunit-dependent GTPase A [Roseburia sp.]MCM1347476.1 ribosome small subunit-dependent GTPase A [Bacteroides sp.]MCM1421969.1 ribosome small subunit-dependent GTPase A [Bacteroides sp.]